MNYFSEKKKQKFAKILSARQLRKEATETEQILWQYLRNRRFMGRKFRRQHVFRGFILDFYCPEEKLAIELDGSAHSRQKDYDFLRQNLIENLGIKILRFQNKAVLKNINNVLETIANHFRVPSLSQMERGADFRGAG